MKKIASILVMFFSLFYLTGCTERVQPNELGVLVENYGKDPSKDYSIVAGKVYTAGLGTTLYKIPAYEQRNTFEKQLKNKSSDGTEFSVTPSYSYRVDPKQATRVIREHSKIFDQGDDLKTIETRSLNPAIEEIVRENINNSTSLELMATGGNTKFNNETRDKVEKALKERGFTLLSFSTILDYSDAVKKSIDSRNQANSEVTTLDSKILRAKKEKELAQIAAETALIKNNAITDQQLKLELIRKWDGKLPSTFIPGASQGSPLNYVLK